jgi:SagB-type dehydrogenase family enzyme
MEFKTKRRSVLKGIFHWVAVLWLAPFCYITQTAAKVKTNNRGETMKLPLAKTEGMVSVEHAIKQRRTHRSFTKKEVGLNQLSQLLWAAGGITEDNGFKRAAPSGGALYPIDIYVAVGRQRVAELDAGLYRYEPNSHMVTHINQQDLRGQIAGASLFQMWMADAPIQVIIVADYSRSTIKYKNRGIRYAMIEAGHMGQNVFLQAEALGLKAGIVGAFNDKKLIKIMDISPSYEPLLVMPIGYSK